MRIAIAALLVGACDGHNGGVALHDANENLGETCTLDAAVHGDVEWMTTTRPGCVVPFGPDVGVTMEYVPIGDGDVVESFVIDVPDLVKLATGDHAAAVTIRSNASKTYATTSCSVSITRNEYRMDGELDYAEFAVFGTGACTASATETGGAGAVTIAPFAFHFPARWPK